MIDFDLQSLRWVRWAIIGSMVAAFVAGFLTHALVFLWRHI